MLGVRGQKTGSSDCIVELVDTYLEGQGDYVSTLVTPITHVITLDIPL